MNDDEIRSGVLFLNITLTEYPYPVLEKFFSFSCKNNFLNVELMIQLLNMNVE